MTSDVDDRVDSHLLQGVAHILECEDCSHLLGAEGQIPEGAARLFRARHQGHNIRETGEAK